MLIGFVVSLSYHGLFGYCIIGLLHTGTEVGVPNFRKRNTGHWLEEKPSPKMLRFMSMTTCGVRSGDRDLVSRTASQAHYSRLTWGREIVQYWENGISFDRREQGHLAREWGLVLRTYKDIRRRT